MENSNYQDIKTLFSEAIRNPGQVSFDSFDLLLAQYPYAQPLVFAFLKKQKKENSFSGYQKALLFTNNKYGLKTFFEESEEGQPQEILIEEETEGDFVQFEEIADQTEDEKELDTLITGNVGMSDFFAVHGEQEETDVQEEEPDQETASQQQEEVSVYDDNLMPYSFRWWLYKTRLEYADTYQPFAKPEFPKPQKGQFDPQKLDAAILDQQIKENIFHLQNPEDKLSDDVKKKTVEANISKKTDKIIDRFIQEDPQIQAPTPDALNSENKARKSSEDQLSLVSETLANIYIDQGLYQKAIEVFRKLILMNPGKKSYFATRIQEIEQKI